MTEFIPQANPGANYRAHQAEIDAAIHAALDSGWYILGQQVQQFEAEFAAFLGVPHVVGVANGTDAIVLALRAAGLQPGQLVYTVSHTAVATVAAIELAGGIPVFVDIDPQTYTMSTDHLDDLLTDPPLDGDPAVVLPVHLYGHPADLHGLTALAEKHGLTLIEDCAQSHGADYHGQRTGTVGRLATFSLYPTKNLGALGDGGAVATADPDLAATLGGLRQYGWMGRRYISEFPGLNSRLDELQAAILRVKLAHLSADNARRQAIAAVYDAALANTSVQLPTVAQNCTHVYHQYVIRLPAHLTRETFMADLKAQGIGTAIHYPVPVHQQPAYADRLAHIQPLPHTEAAARQIVSLPIYPELPIADAERVAEAMLGWLRSH